MALPANVTRPHDAAMIERITVGYDGSHSSREAVRWAADAAVFRDVPLRIVSSYDLPVAGIDIAGWPATNTVTVLAEAAETMIAEVCGAIRATHPGLVVNAVVTRGLAATVLVELVRSTDLLVVGASGHRGSVASVLGSTPAFAVRRSPCPVVVVRSAATRGRPHRIIVGIDGSSASNTALRWAVAEAEFHHVPLVVVHCWHYPYKFLTENSASARDFTQVDAALVLERAVSTARDLALTEVTGQQIEDGAVSGLLAQVRDGDLLVLGPHGRGTLASYIGASTVRGVLERCPVPVVVVRPIQPD